MSAAKKIKDIDSSIGGLKMVVLTFGWVLVVGLVTSYIFDSFSEVRFPQGFVEGEVILHDQFV